MTTQGQELTLFGGWAKVLIPPPIESGVDRPSVTPSASIYIRGVEVGQTSTYLKIVLNRVGYPIVSSAMSDIEIYGPPETSASIFTDRSLTPTGASLDHALNHRILPYPVCVSVEIIRYGFDTHTRKEVLETINPRGRPERVGESNQWKRICYAMWTDKAFVRFFEIWTRGTQETILRGLAGTETMKRFIAGKVGGNHLTRLESGEWTPGKLADIYPYKVKPLPASGIANARSLARKLQQRRDYFPASGKVIT